MGKKGIALLLGFVWFLHLTSIVIVPVQFDPISQETERIDVVHEASIPSVSVLVSTGRSVIPGFMVDWTLWSNFCPGWFEFYFFDKFSFLSFLSNGNKSIPFFDVTQTFIHFFHPW